MFIKCSLLDSCVEHNWSVVENECLLNFSRMVWVTLLPNIALSTSEQVLSQLQKSAGQYYLEAYKGPKCAA